MAVINNYNSSLNYIARMRVVGNQNIPAAGSPMYTIPVGNTASFSGVPEDFYEVGISIVNAQGVESPIQWQPVCDSSIPLTVPLGSGISGTGFTMNWPAIPGATGYEYQIDHGQWISTPTNQIVVTNLTANKVYAVKVRAVRGLARGHYTLNAVWTIDGSTAPIYYVERVEIRTLGGAYLSGINRIVIGVALKTIGDAYTLTDGFTVDSSVVGPSSQYPDVLAALTDKLIILEKYDGALFSYVEFVDYSDSGAGSLPPLSFSIT